MKKILSVLSVMLILASCGGGYNQPDYPVKNDKDLVVDFSYTTSHPFYVKFNNKSDHAPKYRWDFGDGYTSTERSPIHKYKSKGVYKVVLTIGDSKVSYKKEKNVTVVDPTKCFVSGVVYEKIPKNNEYYNVRFTDDYLFFETLYWYTDWVLLSSANMPYTYTLKGKKQIDFNIEKYVIRLYTNENTSGTGSEIAKWNLYPSNVKSDFSEKLSGTIDNAKISVLLEWRD